MMTPLAPTSSSAALRRPGRSPLAVAATVLVATAAMLATVLVAPASALKYDAVVDITFPVDGPTYYVDSYEAGRSGGRVHMATDVMADYGQPVHAAMGGTITWITGIDGPVPSYGYMITIRGDDGRDYSYIHLGDQRKNYRSAYAKGINKGKRVERGQLIGTVGHSGNASRSAPHLHFEIEDRRVKDPYGTNRMNPYRSLKAAEKRGDVPGAVRKEPETKSTGPVVISGDWFGEGADGIGWWNDGKVRLRGASGRTASFTYGRGGDLPIVGDWDGDGTDTLGIVRDRQWHLSNSHSGGRAEHTFTYGKVTDGDVPIVGDWNGDGVDTPGIIRDGEWHLRNAHSGGNGQEVFTYGRIARGDLPLVGDWLAEGRDRPGIVRSEEWHLRHSFSDGPADQTYVYGRVTGGDTPLMGDWNGDGVDTPAIVRDEEFHLKHEHGDGNADQLLTLSRP